ncbi:hypothetical protein IWX46DRAFT_595639 [Phyllosticta citricarpa]|uniref:SH3 domain-containing protein n=1 Tax=Phyllosticta citricarpa TaxID=55181 RepID=A0ABR1MIM4_9PEZI
MTPDVSEQPTKFPCWCKAVYSWGGESKRDLGFIEGDLIECLNAGDGKRWMGRLKRDKRVVGLFPANFVEVLEDTDVGDADDAKDIAENEAQVGLDESANGEARGASPQDSKEEDEPTGRRRWWIRNRGWVLVLLSESFGACMAAMARLLENEEDESRRMHPMQIIFVRMGLTAVFSMTYMWATKVPHFPWGEKGLRLLLTLRGFTGFFGLSVFYWGLQYLPLAETTVITFLTPMLVPWACALFFGQPLSKKVIFAGVFSFAGVIIIAQPPWLFPNHREEVPNASAAMRTIAVTGLLIGAVTATASYTIIRGIGYRAHALISVNYYSLTSTLGSGLFLLFAPGVGFQLPADGRQWAFLSVLGLSGFLLQFLLSAGLQHDKSAVATSMMYSQVLFALVLDKTIWGNVPGTASLCGGALVLASTIYVAFQGSSETQSKTKQSDEEEPLLAKRGEENGTWRKPVKGGIEASANLADE